MPFLSKGKWTFSLNQSTTDAIPCRKGTINVLMRRSQRSHTHIRMDGHGVHLYDFSEKKE